MRAIPSADEGDAKKGTYLLSMNNTQTSVSEFGEGTALEFEDHNTYVSGAESDAQPTISTSILAVNKTVHNDDAVHNGEDDGGLASTPCQAKVKFVHKIKVHRIPHLSDLPEDVVASTWYNRSEFDAVKRSYQVTVRMIMKGHVFTSYDEDTNSHCTRGLEYRTKEGARFKQKVKLYAMLAVLDEQDRQRQAGVRDPESLSKAYRQESEKATSRAFVRGLKDELDIQEYLHGDLTFSSSSSSDETEGCNRSDVELGGEMCMEDIPLGPADAVPGVNQGSQSFRPQDNGMEFIGGSRDTPANPLSSPTEQNRLRLLRSISATSSATSSRRQEILDDIETVSKEKKQLRRHLCGAAAWADHIRTMRYYSPQFGCMSTHVATNANKQFSNRLFCEVHSLEA